MDKCDPRRATQKRLEVLGSVEALTAIPGYWTASSLLSRAKRATKFQCAVVLPVEEREWQESGPRQQGPYREATSAVVASQHQGSVCMPRARFCLRSLQRGDGSEDESGCLSAAAGTTYAD